MAEAGSFGRTEFLGGVMVLGFRTLFKLWLLLAMLAFMMPAKARAEEPALNDVQRTGKRLYLQNCALCHAPTKKNNKDPKDPGTTIGPRLNGLFSGPKALSDSVARTFIQKGVPNKMPGFQYGLEPKEVDAIIAYLKTT